jgi:hypothetical protein
MENLADEKQELVKVLTPEEIERLKYKKPGRPALSPTKRKNKPKTLVKNPDGTYSQERHALSQKRIQALKKMQVARMEGAKRRREEKMRAAEHKTEVLPVSTEHLELHGDKSKHYEAPSHPIASEQKRNTFFF